jgi:hypothetical protein
LSNSYRVHQLPAKSSFFPARNQPELLDTPLPTGQPLNSNEQDQSQQPVKDSLALTVTKVAPEVMDVDDHDNPSHSINVEVEKLDDIVFGADDEIPSSSNTSVILNSNSYDQNDNDIRLEENSLILEDEETDRLPSKKIKRHLDFSLLFDDTISDKNTSNNEQEKENQQPQRKKQKATVTPLKIGQDLSVFAQSLQFPTSASKRNIARPSFRPNLKRKQVSYLLCFSCFSSLSVSFRMKCNFRMKKKKKLKHISLKALRKSLELIYPNVFIPSLTVSVLFV